MWQLGHSLSRLWGAYAHVSAPWVLERPSSGVAPRSPRAGQPGVPFPLQPGNCTESQVHSKGLGSCGWVRHPHGGPY